MDFQLLYILHNSFIEYPNHIYSSWKIWMYILMEDKRAAEKSVCLELSELSEFKYTVYTNKHKEL
jgi:hypothetical protein